MKKLLLLLSFLFVVSCTKDPIIYTLTTSANPSEGGTVSPVVKVYNEGETATINATPATEYIFQSWSGATGSASSTSLVMSSDKSVTANFVKKKYALTTSVEGEGTVSEKVIKAGTATDYNSGTIVELTATPSAEWLFVEWTGDLTGTDNPKQITIDKAKTVTAVFVKKQYALTIEIEGEGTVMEKVIKAGVATDYNSGTVVELTALPKDGREFKEWSGDLSGVENPINITVDKAKTVKAIFVGKPIFYINNGKGQIQVNSAIMDGDNIIIVGDYNNPEKDLDELNFSYAGSAFSSYIISISKNGQINWGRDFNSDIISLDRGILKTNDNNFLRWGSFPDEEETRVNGKKDVFVQKISNSGQEIWTKKIGGSDVDGFYNSAGIENSDGSFEFTGLTRSRDGDFKDLKSQEGYDAKFLMKVDSNGNSISSFDLNEGGYGLKQWEWTHLEGQQLIKLNNSRKLIIGGDTMFTESTFPTRQRGVNMALYDDSYNLIWKDFYKTDIFMFGFGQGNLIEDPSGDFILRTTYNVNNAKNAQLTKISQNNVVIWSKKFIEEGHINDFVLNDSEIIIAGYKPEYAFTRSYSSDGELNWEKKYNGNNLYVYKIIKNDSGYILIGVTRENEGLFIDNPIENGDYYNLFLINIDFEGNIKP